MDPPTATSLEMELYSASCDGNSARVLMLCEKGVNPDGFRDQFKNTALIRSVLMGHIDIVRILVAYEAHVNARARSGHPVLLLASCYNHLRICSTLIHSQADVNAQVNNSRTPLIGASYFGNPEVVSLLLRHGADMGIRDEDGSALMNAQMRGNDETVQILLEHHGEGRRALMVCSDRLLMNAVHKTVRVPRRRAL